MAGLFLVVMAVIMLKYATQISFNNSTKTGFIKLRHDSCNKP